MSRNAKTIKIYFLFQFISSGNDLLEDLSIADNMEQITADLIWFQDIKDSCKLTLSLRLCKYIWVDF